MIVLEKVERTCIMNKFEDMLNAVKLQEVFAKKNECKAKKVVIWVLAIVGVVAAVAAIAYAVYRFLTPDYLEDFEEEFEDEFEDDFVEECFEDSEV